MLARRFATLALLLTAACGDDETVTPVVVPPVVVPPLDTGHFCSLPGSVQYFEGGNQVVPGGHPETLSSWLKLPPGFCAHAFGNVGNNRQLRFAPGGELFVASPTVLTTGGGDGGLSAIVFLADDDGDGEADSVQTFLDGIGATQGLLFTEDHFYWQHGTSIFRMPYEKGQRAPSSDAPELVADITIYTSPLHWPKTLDQADDGTIYVANGGDQDEACDPSHPFHGGILKLDGSPGGTPVTRGLRNPIAVRCARGHDQCFAAELAKDYSGAKNGREKLIPIRQDDNWGFPCCASLDLPYSDVTPVPDCSGVTKESEAFVIGNTPFSFDFETGKWSGAWNGNAFVPLHGAAGTWAGAKVVAISMDPTTGLPIEGSNLPGEPMGGMKDFATGWDDGKRAHGRPASITFSPDGRLFLGNDNDGSIIWITPFGT